VHNIVEYLYIYIFSLPISIENTSSGARVQKINSGCCVKGIVLSGRFMGLRFYAWEIFIRYKMLLTSRITK